MKHTSQLLRRHGLLALAAALVTTAAHGQFVLPGGSDGSMGALNVTANTVLQVPPNGVFHFTTINVDSGRTLSFTRNSNNTPVFLFATGDITISGTIQVNGSNWNNAFSSVPGGPGGGDGGYTSAGGTGGGAGGGPGGGRAGLGNLDGNNSNPSLAGPGSFGALGAGASTNRSPVYGGPLLRPMVGGSGGGGTQGNDAKPGGGGGGAIRIASSTRIALTGTVQAKGGDAEPGAGSGGAIHLIAPVVTGNGTLDVTGGAILRTGFGIVAGFAGRGRTRVDAFDRRTMQFSGIDSIGSHVVGLEAPVPRLDIVEVAGTNVPLGSIGPVQIILPTDAPAAQTIRIRAAILHAVTPFELQLRPWNGAPIVISNIVDNLSQDPAFVDVSVNIPPNTLFYVEAWKR